MLHKRRGIGLAGKGFLLSPFGTRNTPDVQKADPMLKEENYLRMLHEIVETWKLGGATGHSSQSVSDRVTSIHAAPR